MEISSWENMRKGFTVFFFFFPLCKNTAKVTFLDIWPEWECLYSQWNWALIRPDFLPLPFIWPKEQITLLTLLTLLAPFAPEWRMVISDAHPIDAPPTAPHSLPHLLQLNLIHYTLQGHIITQFKKIIFLPLSPGMEAGVQSSGGFPWTGCVLWIHFALSREPRECLIRTTSQGGKTVFAFPLHSMLGSVTGIE